MLELIREHESLFAKVPPAISARQPGGSRASPSALRQAHLHPSPCLRQLSLPLIAERSREPGHPAADAQNPSCVYSAAKSDLSSGQKKRLGHRYTSSHPENCFYPLPSSSQPVQHHSGQANIDYHQHRTGQAPSPANIQASTTSLQLQDQLPDSSKTRPMLMGWAKAWPDPGKAGAGFWSSAAAEDGGAVPETASRGSSEAQEDSNLSAYDNLDKVSQCHTMEDVTGEHLDTNDPGDHIGTCEEEAELKKAAQTRDSSSSWSSCEVIPLDESGDAVGAVSPDISPKRSKRLRSGQIAGKENSHNDKHEDNNDNDDDENDDEDEDEDDDDIHHPNSPASGSVLSDSPLSTGSSEVFLPSVPPDPQGPESQSLPRDAHILLAELRQQMAQQRAEYQAKIQRLERCNDVLERQIAILRVSLEQQKRSQSVAEIKIRNMERAKADADLRNTTLQKEMELFFQMYGEFRRRGGDGGRGGGSL